MYVCIPTLKYTDHSEGVVYKNIINSCFLSEEKLIKFGLNIDLVKAINMANTGSERKVEDSINGVTYLVNFEIIAEAHHYSGDKLSYLKENGLWLSHIGWILPINKGAQFLNGDIPVKPKREIKTVEVSVVQDRIADTGKYTEHYVVFNDECDGYPFVNISQKTNWKRFNHKGKYLHVALTRPQYMWGTNEEVEKEIKGIILKHLVEIGYADCNESAFDREYKLKEDMI